MILFIVRRILISIPILIASTFLVFWLVTISGDPLEELYGRQTPNLEQQIAQRRAALELDKPFPERYASWASGVITGDWGQNKNGQDVGPIVRDAVITTLRLVVLATAVSIMLGVAVGILSAVRQYSSFDNASTFAAFLFYATPVFWLAVLLKQFGAIELNDWLTAPSLSIGFMLIVAVLTGLFWGGVIGGSRRRRLLGALIGAAVTLGILAWLNATDWFSNPGLSLPVVAVFAGVGAVVGTLAFSRLENRRVLFPAIGTAVTGVVLAAVAQSWLEDANWTRLFVLSLLAFGAAGAWGAALGGIDRRQAISASVVTSVFVGGVVLLDQFMSAWSPGRTVATVDPQSPNLEGPFWVRMIDYAGHQMLPTIALALITFAAFSRYTRGSMLDTLKTDYVRTAKAKGLPAGQVILRHAFRTALIPVTTVIALSFGTIIEGAVITETVFNWRGMGRLFRDGLLTVDPYPVMAFLVIVGLAVVVFNALADIAYAWLDPRIRLE